MFTKILRYISCYSPLVAHHQSCTFPSLMTCLVLPSPLHPFDGDVLDIGQQWLGIVHGFCVGVVSSFLRYWRPCLWGLTRAPNTGNKAPQGNTGQMWQFRIEVQLLWIFLLQISDWWFSSYPDNWDLSPEGPSRSITKIHLKLQNTAQYLPIICPSFFARVWISPVSSS